MPLPWLSNPIYAPPKPLIPRSRIPPAPNRVVVRRLFPDIPVSVVRAAIGGKPVKRIPLTPAEQVLKLTCTLFNMSKVVLRGAGQTKLEMSARTYAATRLRSEHGLSYTQIGQLLNRDHSSIYNMLNPEHRKRKKIRAAAAWKAREK